MTTRSRLGAVLLSALVPAVGLLAPAPPAAAAQGFTVVTDLPYAYPRQVPMAGSGQATRISVVVTSSEPVTVTARSYDGGLAIADPVRSLGATPQATPVSFDIAALTPGFHQLAVQVDGSTGPPYFSQAVGYPNVWASGSAVPPTTPTPGRDTVLTFGYQAPGAPARLLTFVTDQLARLGLPADGEPECAEGDPECVPYWRDPHSGLLQVGTTIVAFDHRGGLYTDGFVPPGPATGTPYGRYDFINRLYYVSARTGLHQTYAYVDRTRTSGLVQEKVTFLRAAGDLVGDYRLTYTYAGHRKRTLEGTFRTENNGAVTFRDDRGRVVQRGTLLGTGRALPCAIKGTCRVDRGGHPRGIWLILSGRRGTHPDGNLLQPVR